jgi:hypothetical protein
VAWVIEPLAIGLALFAVNVKQRSSGLFVAGVALCALAVVGALESVAIVVLTAFLPMWWLWKFMGPVTLIIVGIGLLIWGLIRRAPQAVASAS